MNLCPFRSTHSQASFRSQYLSSAMLRALVNVQSVANLIYRPVPCRHIFHIIDVSEGTNELATNPYHSNSMKTKDVML